MQERGTNTGATVAHHWLEHVPRHRAQNPREEKEALFSKLTSPHHRASRFELRDLSFAHSWNNLVIITIHIVRACSHILVEKVFRADIMAYPDDCVVVESLRVDRLEIVRFSTDSFTGRGSCRGAGSEIGRRSL